MTNDPVVRVPNAAPRHLTIGLLPWEDEEMFEGLFRDYFLEFSPAGPAEIRLVEQLVWLDWRRRRLQLAERALHMATLERNTSSERHDMLSRRALAHIESPRPETSSSKAIKSGDASDADEVISWENMLASAETAQALLLDRPNEAYEAALSTLPPETREWFEETAEEENTRYPANADGLTAFVKREVLPFFRGSLAGHQGGPAIRLQAWGESVEPDRMDHLLGVEERLLRQFDKTIAQLLALQKRRGSSAKSAGR